MTKTDEKTRRLWRVTAVLFVDLIILFIISSVIESSANAVKLGTQGETVVLLQKKLGDMGHYVGEASGLFDPETKRAVKSFQRNEGLKVTGEADCDTLRCLGVYSRDCCFADVQLLARYLGEFSDSELRTKCNAACDATRDRPLTTLGYIMCDDPDFLRKTEDKSVSFASIHEALRAKRDRRSDFGAKTRR